MARTAMTNPTRESKSPSNGIPSECYDAHDMSLDELSMYFFFWPLFVYWVHRTRLDTAARASSHTLGSRFLRRKFWGNPDHWESDGKGMEWKIKAGESMGIPGDGLDGAVHMVTLPDAPFT